MARKNPVGKLAETALSTIKDPKAAAEKVVDSAKGTIAFGRIAAETGVSVAGAVVARAVRRRGRQETYAPTTPPVGGTTAAPTARADLRPVPEVNEPAGTQPAPQRTPQDSPKKHGDTLSPVVAEPEEAGGKKAGASRTPTRPPVPKDPAAQKAAKQAAAKKTTTKKGPAKTAAKKGPAKTAATPADVADVVEAAVAQDPGKTAAEPATKKTAAKKAPATRKAPAKQSSPGGKLPVRKPKSAAEVAEGEGEDVRTPSGIPAADQGTNPSTGDTGLTQPGTEPVIDPATAKQVTSEQETLRKAAETEPE